MGGKGNGSKKRGATDDTQEMLAVIMAMYLDGGVPSCNPIRRVAQELGISYQRVCAFMARAYDDNLYSVFVHLPYEVTQVKALEQAVRLRYGLKRVRLVPGYPAMLTELTKDQRRRLHTAVIRLMAPQAAGLLDDIVTDAAQSKTECTLSVAWGRTMKLFADYLDESDRRTRWSKLRVLPLLGPTAWAKTDPVEASIIARRIAGTYGGSWAQLPCPAFVRAENLGHWMALEEVSEILRHLRDSHCVITSLGPIPASEDLVDVTLSNDLAMSNALAEAARAAGAIGEINYWAFTASGAMAETAYRAIGLGFDGLKALSADPSRSVILMCGGDRYRLDALKAALTAGLCNVLISDTVTARYLIGEPQPSKELAHSIPQE